MTDPANAAVDERLLRDSPFAKNAPLAPQIPEVVPPGREQGPGPNPFSLGEEPKAAAAPKANPFSLAPSAAPVEEPKIAKAPPTGVDHNEARPWWWWGPKNGPREFLGLPPDSGESPDLKDVPGEFAKNLVPNLREMAEGVGHLVATGATKAYEDPGGSLKAIAEGLPDLPGHLGNVGAHVITNLVKSYGSWDAAKRTAAEKPAEFLMDMLPFLGQIPKVGKVLALGDPAKAMTSVRKIAEKGGDAAAYTADQAVQSLEGIGEGAVREMFQSGKEVSPGAWKAMTGGLDFEKSYGMIKDALGSLFKQRSAEYDLNMSKLASADKPVDFAKVDKALAEVGDTGYYKAPGDTRPGPGYKIAESADVTEMRRQISEEVLKFKQDWGKDYHTAMGFDKLKQSIHRLGEGMKDGVMPTPASRYASQVERAIKQTIMDEVPQYGKAMEAYEQASDQIEGLIREFNLGSSNKLTTLRKLQKVWRYSADTAHGETTNVLRTALKDAGKGEDLMSHLAAAQFHPVFPRGIRGAVFWPATVLSGGLGPILAGGMSPRLAGTMAYGAGRVAGSPFAKAPAAAYKAAEKVAPTSARLARWGAPGDENAVMQPDSPTTGSPFSVAPARARGGFFRGR